MTTNFKPIPISQPPEKEGSYIIITKNETIVMNRWDGTVWWADPINHAYYLLPIPDSVILTQSELEKIAGGAWDAACSRSPYPDKQTYINNLLTGK